jgi:hypothetical protein
MRISNKKIGRKLCAPWRVCLCPRLFGVFPYSDTSIVPIIAGAAGTTALAAYLNAKYHIAHDLKNARGGISQSKDAVDFITDRATRKRLLTYHVFEDQVRNQPDHPFLVFEGKTWSYKEFFEALNKVGNWLIDDLGIQPDEVVAMDGGNSPEYLMLWFAIDAIGAVPSFVNWNLTGTGLVHCVRASSPGTERLIILLTLKIDMQLQVSHRRRRC